MASVYTTYIVMCETSDRAVIAIMIRLVIKKVSGAGSESDQYASNFRSASLPCYFVDKYLYCYLNFQ